jgi:hypothetical protein
MAHFIRANGGSRRAARWLLSVVGLAVLLAGAAGSSRSEEEKAREKQEEERKKDLENEFKRFTATNCPELTSVRGEVEKLIADKEERVKRIEEVLQSRNMPIDQDKDVKRWRAQLDEAKKLRDDLDRRANELFVEHQKIVYAPDETQEQKVKRDAAVANEFAKTSAKSLERLRQSAN